MIDHSSSYRSYIEELKSEISKARLKAMFSVNKELIFLYWKIGKKILKMQEEKGWGAKVVEQVSKDLRTEFPNMKGLSVQNIAYMRQFSKEYEDVEIIQQLVGEIPWGHNLLILSKIKNQKERIWYIQKTVENGWSRNLLSLQIDSDLYARQGGAITNFKETLPAPQSDLAHEILKSPYNFEFLDIEDKITERKVEQALISQIRDFMLELGRGFAFVGSQYPVKLGKETYFLDLLFYNLRLRAYTIIELKIGPFKPEYAGKMNFYLNLVDKQVKSKEDNPSIGIILCRDNDHILVTYSLEGIQRPLGVSEYKLTQELTERLKEALPSEENLQKELEEELDHPEIREREND